MERRPRKLVRYAIKKEPGVFDLKVKLQKVTQQLCLREYEIKLIDQAAF